MWRESLETLRREEMWFKAAINGTEADIKRMGELLCEDPNRFYCDWDHRKLLNCGREKGVELMKITIVIIIIILISID